jgi:Uma2 family endonuclease
LTAWEAASTMDDVLATIDVQRRRFTVDEYYRMASVGILTEKDRVELIEGEIMQMAPIGPRHSECFGALLERLMPAVLGRAKLRPQLPLFVSSTTEPEPDIVLVLPGFRYWTEHPRPEDVLLVVEVAETSYRYDRDVKLPLYARAGIADVWIVDLVHALVEVYREPGPDGYRSTQRLGRGATVSPAAFPDVMIPVDEILPPTP